MPRSGAPVSNRYELDLSNEVLYLFVGQGAEKIQEFKVRGQKENC